MTTTEPSTAERAALEQTRGLASDVHRDFVVSNLEVRTPTDGGYLAEFYGYASVTGKPYEMYGGPDKGGWNETVSRGAFKKTLADKPDVPFKINHEGMTLARTKAGNLQLREDTNGLEVKAQLDTRVTAVNDLVLLMEAGNIDEMSFAFRIRKQRWLNTDGEEVPWWDLSGVDRHLDELDIHKGDVSVVNYGASPHTSGASILRDLSELRLLSLEACSEAELRDAIAYLESLVPRAATMPMDHTFSDSNSDGMCDVAVTMNGDGDTTMICGMSEAMHDMQMPARSVHPDLVVAQHRTLGLYSELRSNLL